MKNGNQTNQGSVLLWTVMTLIILSIFGAEVVRVVSSKYHNTLQTSTWQESLLAAESGIDLAVVELRKSLYPAPNHAWDGWNGVPGNGTTSYESTVIPNAGLAGTPMTVEVSVDAPAQMVDPSTGWQYYRVRTTGTLPLTGPARAPESQQDSALRKLSLLHERFTNGILVAHAINSPQVSRRVEAVVKPDSSFDEAIFSVGMLDLTDHNIVIDSYDSRDPTKSTNGQYDVNKRQQHGNIATDGQVLDAGNAYVYGDVATNAGTASDIGHVTGSERDDFYQDPIPIIAPNWSSYNQNPSTVTQTTTINANSISGSPASRYVLNTISLSGNRTLTIAGDSNGAPTYAEIYVTGDVSTTGNAQIILRPGVNAKIYFAGNLNSGGNGILNMDSNPLHMQLYGIQPPQGTRTPSVSLSGNSQIMASLYAPNHNVTVNGAGSNGQFFGSIVGATVTMTGVTNLHYDEAMGAGGLIDNYRIVSWFEDNR
jgi:hypothetical protein